MRNSISFNKKIFSVFLILISVTFSSCFGPKDTPRLVIGEDFYYWEAGAESNLGDAMRNAREFKKLEAKSTRNLRNVLGSGSHYVWVRADFEIPPGFKGQPLGFRGTTFLQRNIHLAVRKFSAARAVNAFQGALFLFPDEHLKSRRQKHDSD